MEPFRSSAGRLLLVCTLAAARVFGAVEVSIGAGDASESTRDSLGLPKGTTDPAPSSGQTTLDSAKTTAVVEAIDEFIEARRGPGTAAKKHSNEAPLRDGIGSRSTQSGLAKLNVRALTRRIDLIAGAADDTQVQKLQKAASAYLIAELNEANALERLSVAAEERKPAIQKDVQVAESQSSAAFEEIRKIQQILKARSAEGGAEVAPARSTKKDALGADVPESSGDARTPANGVPVTTRTSDPVDGPVEGDPDPKKKTDPAMALATSWRDRMITQLNSSIKELTEEEKETLQGMKRSADSAKSMRDARKEYVSARTECGKQIAALKKLEGDALVRAYQAEMKAEAARQAKAAEDRREAASRQASFDRRISRARQIWGNGDLAYCPACVGSKVSALSASVAGSGTVAKFDLKDITPDPHCSRCEGTGFVPSD